MIWLYGLGALLILVFAGAWVFIANKRHSK